MIPETTTATTMVAMTTPVEAFPHHDNEKECEPPPHYHHNSAVSDNHNNPIEEDDDLDGLIMLDHDHDDHSDILISSSSPPPSLYEDANDDDPLQQNWRLSNAVHMELQENAKLPTFSWNVNRAGSSTTNKFDVSQFFVMSSNNNKSRSNTMDDDDGEDEDLFDTGGVDASSVNLEEYLELNGEPQLPPPLVKPPLNLTEIFLTSEMGQRHSNFPTHTSGRFDGTPTTMDLTMMIDPTPLSEIKRKLGAQTTTTSDTEPPLSSHHATTGPTTTTPNVPYWSRREQLPIPSPVAPVPTTTEENHPAVSHDAAAVATNGTVSRPESLDSTVPASVSFPNTSTKAATTTTTSGSTYQTKLIGSWKTQEPQHSTIQSVSRPAVLVASQKRTQYGFGRQHVVPSVPTTSTTTTTSARHKRSSPTNQKKTTKTYSRSTSQRSQSTTVTTPTTTSAASSQVIARAPSATSHDDDDSGSGGGGGGGGGNNTATGSVAYERKKERAKSARIRLNESIDRLQIALNMAGTQSNQRLAMFQEGTIPYRIISDCLKCSEDAKKWDRPSFVGSAATMIQGLNAQCEALVRALHDERHARAEQTVHTTNTATAATDVPVTLSRYGDDVVTPHSTRAATFIPTKGDGSPKSVQVKHGYNSNDNFNKSDTTDGNGETPTKRFKLNDAVCPFDAKPASKFVEQTDANETMFTQLCLTVFEDKSIIDRVASFLDPRSLLRCKRVCRDWKNCGVFTSDALWQRLAVDRFGFYNVRQWLAKVEDFAQKDVHSSSNLYMTMDATNIMPHCRLDGMLLLGESRLLGKVSAWTYMVERSNGETMRSVARHSSMPGAGAYTSLPIVQLRTVIQNTGLHDDAVVIREQTITVDASTRRRGDEMVEIDWDDRFKKRILNLDGTAYVAKVRAARRSSESIYRELFRLRLYEAVVLETNIHARGCATTSKFVQKSNFTKVLVQIRDGTTVPLVIPFPRDASHLLP